MSYTPLVYIPSGMSHSNNQPYEYGCVFRKERIDPESLYKSILTQDGFVKVELRDRTLYVNPYLKMERRLKDSGIDFHHDVNASWINPSSDANSVLDIIMGAIPYISHIRPEYYHFFANLIQFSDSGGFEAASRGHVVNIDEVARYYRKYSKYGITLDLPETEHDDQYPEMMKALCLFQKWNSDYLFNETAGSEFKLFNVLRGVKLPSINQCYDLLNDQRFEKRWAVPGGGLSGLTKACLLINKSEVDWLHFLGVTDTQMIPAMAVIGHFVNHLSSDASSHLEGQKRRKYIKLTKRDLHMDGGVYFGRNYTVKDHPNHELICPCPVCRTIGDSLFFHFDYEDRLSQYILSTHNLFAFKKNFDAWSERAKKLGPTRDFLRLVADVYGADSLAVYYVRFVYKAMNKGVEEAVIWSGVADKESTVRNVSRIGTLNQYISRFGVIYNRDFLRKLPVAVLDWLDEVNEGDIEE